VEKYNVSYVSYNVNQHEAYCFTFNLYYNHKNKKVNYVLINKY